MPHGSLHPNSSSTPNASVDKRESGVKCTEAQNEDVLAGKFLHLNRVQGCVADGDRGTG